MTSKTLRTALCTCVLLLGHPAFGEDRAPVHTDNHSHGDCDPLRDEGSCKDEHSTVRTNGKQKTGDGHKDHYDATYIE